MVSLQDGYRYILAEVDPRTTEKDLDAYAGKAVPGFLYRVVAPPLSLLALHDRGTVFLVSIQLPQSLHTYSAYCHLRH